MSEQAWTCAICGAENADDLNYCLNCHEARPLAPGILSVYPTPGLELPVESVRRREGNPHQWNEERAMAELEESVRQFLRQEIGVEEFRLAVSKVGQAWASLFAFLEKALEDSSQERLRQRLEMRRDEVAYSCKLSLQLMAEAEESNPQPARVGLLVAQQSYKTLTWLMAFARQEETPQPEGEQNLIMGAINEYLEGQLDSDTYFDQICQVDDTLQMIVEEGCDKYRQALEEAQAFNGKNFQLLLHTHDLIVDARNSWLKAMQAVNTGHYKPALQPENPS